MSSLPPLKAAPRVEGKSFRIALCQLGGTTPDKQANLERAKAIVAKAVAHDPKPDMVVLPVRYSRQTANAVRRLTLVGV